MYAYELNLLYVRLLSAGIANIRFQQAEDGTVQLLAVPHSNLGTGQQTEGTRNGCINTETGGSENWPPRQGVNGGGEAVVGEVETLARSHPILRLDFFKATNGFNELKHEHSMTEDSSK